MSQSEKLRGKAIEALAVLFAFAIRNEMDDPDHSGPEDASETLATTVVDAALAELLTSDWRSILK
jgi:hypothetical protein